MKEIKQFAINPSPISKNSISKTYTVTGDEGASFALMVMNEDSNFYNFPENYNPALETKPSPAFTTTPVELSIVTLDASGVYSSNINFPAVTDDDFYDIILIAKGNSTISDSVTTENTYFIPRISQYDDPTVTFSLLHSDSGVAEPSNITSSGVSSKVGASGDNSFSISWPVTLGDGNFIIARQPVESDFEFTTTKLTRTAGSSSVVLELTNIEGLSPGMAVTGEGIASNSFIKYIIPGYKDNSNVNVDGSDVYVLPLSVDTVNGKDFIVNDKGGSIYISQASTFVVGRTITFTGQGASAFKDFSGVEVAITNLLLTIEPIVTTTDASVSNSTTIPITSTNGIKAADTVLMTGIGVTASPHVDSISDGVSVTVSSAQTIENGQTMTFTGSSRTAKVTCDVKISNYGKSDLTLTLNLNNILTVQ